MPSPFYAGCSMLGGAFWIVGVFLFSLALGLAAIALALAGSRWVRGVGIATLVTAVALVATAELVVHDVLPSGGGISPEVTRFAREERERQLGASAARKDEREGRAESTRDCRMASVELSRMPMGLGVAALGLAYFVARARRA